MSVTQNQMHAYTKGDMRRMLVVIAVIAKSDEATMVSIAKATGLDKRTVTHLIRQAQEQAGVIIEKTGPRYCLVEWGTLLNRQGVLDLADSVLAR